MESNLVHLNNNILCAIAIKTTGPRPWFHDMYEVCIYPLNADIMPGEILPFNMKMQLKREENYEMKDRSELVEIKMSIDPWTVAEFFEEWAERLELAFRKRIVPLSSNWAFQRGFIMDWLGHEAFEVFIDDNLARDVTRTALYHNDRADFLNQDIPFPKTNFQYLCSTLKIEKPIKNTVWECRALCEIYRKLVFNSY